MATQQETDALNKAKAADKAAADVRARVASGENERDDGPKVAVTPRSQAEADAQAQRRRFGSADTVMVGCKLPHGLLIALSEETVNDEGKPIFRHADDKVTLKGANASQIIGGYGITEVDAQFWDAWTKQNPKFPALRNGLIFAEPRADRAMDRASEQKDVQTGTEALDPDKPGRGLSKLDPEEQKRAAAMSGG